MKIELIEKEIVSSCKLFKMFKFVKINNEYRFIDVDSNFNHTNMVEKSEYNQIKGAGILYVKGEDSWTFFCKQSDTLKEKGVSNYFVTEEIDIEIEEMMSPREYCS